MDKNGTVIVGQTTSSYKFNVTKADNNAKIKVTIKGGCKPDVASKECVITVKDGGAITEGPKDLELCVGNPAKFSVKATGSGITYQWKKNGVNIPGENKADLSITSVSEADAGFYTVEVTGACAITGSGPLTAKLSISKPFTITSQPTGTQNVCPGGSISFSVTVSGGKNLKYQWKRMEQHYQVKLNHLTQRISVVLVKLEHTHVMLLMIVVKHKQLQLQQ